MSNSQLKKKNESSGLRDSLFYKEITNGMIISESAKKEMIEYFMLEQFVLNKNRFVKK